MNFTTVLKLMDDIRIIKEKITLEELKEIAKEWYGNMAKGVADVERGIIAVSGELHSDEEAALLDDGSLQRNLWGFNIYFDRTRDSWMEFHSMINLRPSQGNHSRTVEDEKVRAKIAEIVNNLIA